MPRTVHRARYVAAAAAGLLSVGTLVVVSQLPAAASSAVTVNGATSYQRIDGFGVSEAFGQANSIRNLPSGPRQKALDLLFSPTGGAGLTILRSLIAANADSIEPDSPGSPSATPTYVWNGSDDAQDQGQVWLAKQAKAYGVTNFYNDAWSAPGFMKTNGSESNGGALCGTTGASCSSGDWRQAYANYLTQHAKFWSSVGLTPSYVGFVNEPSFKTGYSSMDVTPAQAADFVKVFEPTLKASGLSTRVACCDTLGFNQLPDYVSAVRGLSAAKNANVGVLTSHGYSGAPASPITSDGRPVWNSEWAINGSTFNTAWDNGIDSSGIAWAQRIHTGLTGANLNAFLYWWGISATSHDSSLIGLSGSTLTPTKRYDALANYSRFIRPGAVRISATTGDGNLKVSAYRNSDGSVIVVALNTAGSDTATSFAVANAGVSGGADVTPYLTNGANSTAAQARISLSAAGSFTATVPARSLVTYRITGGGTPPTTAPTTPPTTAPTTPTTTVPTTPTTTVPTTTAPTTATTTAPTTTVPTTTGPTTTVPTTPPTTTPTSGCTATYKVVNGWNTGFQAEVTVTNRGSAPLRGWTVTWSVPSGQAIIQLWNGTLTTSGRTATVRNAAWNSTIPARARTSFGMLGSGPSTVVPKPTCTSP